MKKFLLLALLLVTQTVWSQIPKPQKNTYVNDFAKVLTTDEVASLNKAIFEIEQKTSVQFAVVLVNKIPAAYEIEDYALLIGRKWHVGKNKNGIVYVAAIQQHKQRLQIATGLDSTFTKDTRQAILGALNPYFKRTDYAGGLQLLVSQIGQTLDANLLKAPTRATSAAVNTAIRVSKPVPNNNAVYGIIILVIVLVVVAYVIYSYKQSSGSTVGSGTGLSTGPAASYNNMPAAGYNNPGYNSGYNNGGMPVNSYPNHSGSGVGSFVAGAAVGAIAGYAANSLLNNHGHHHGGNYNTNNGITGGYGDNSFQADDSAPADTSSSSDYGNWGGSSSSSDDSSYSSTSSDDSSSYSSSDDSGFSSDSSDDSGSTSSW
ncbi:putative membrane protein YgcG [Mucilaginibacter gracilis]|uniref:Putative membrane protein YgcG n=1 Tax=Mucilaginibacter gracilis TaxID=423350 RepID=A0A495IV63_9SPHI|nr:TPM domain-containing protein [Mucilaginibacter gracilis]RKR80647.1 putative membrane protein YgcG [Mucilaginibacter gracilis]